MTGFVLSPLAQSDLSEIWDYTEQRWNQAQAEKYIRAIQASIQTITSDPGLGRSCDEIRAGYFKYPVGSHVLFYRVSFEAIEIVRILHARMDFDSHL